MTEPGLFTLGVEEEFQIVDPQTRELKSHIQQIIEDGKVILAEHVKAEMHQSVVEIGTDICKDINDARDQVQNFDRNLQSLRRRAISELLLQELILFLIGKISRSLSTLDTRKSFRITSRLREQI